MPYTLFYSYCPEIAEKETRVISILSSNNELGLPIGDYGFLELFCDECDCRRVFITVMKGEKSLATLFWGWGSVEFYEKSFFTKDKKYIMEELIGPNLNHMSQQSILAPKVLKLFIKELFADKLYLERIKRHYKQFKEELDSKIG